MRLLPGYYQASTRLLPGYYQPGRLLTGAARAPLGQPAPQQQHCSSADTALRSTSSTSSTSRSTSSTSSTNSTSSTSSPPAQHQQQQQQQQQPSRVVDEWCETMLFWTSYLLSYLYLICATRAPVRCITTPSHHQSPQTALRWADATSGSAETQRRDLPPHSSRCAMHHHLGALRPTRKTALPEKPCLRLTDSRLQLLSCCCALLLACTGAEGAPDRADA